MTLAWSPHLIIACVGCQKSHVDVDTRHSAVVPNPSTVDTATRCPTFAKGKEQGKVASKDLREASGLAVSRRNEGVLYSHNDSGGKNRLYALSASGQDLGEYSIRGADAEDWEDLALGPGPDVGASYLYIGDIGDNEHERESIFVYRVREPEVKLSQASKKRKLAGAARFELRYADGRARDAEVLLVDPQGGGLYVVSKTLSQSAEVWRLTDPLDSTKPGLLRRVARLDARDGDAGRGRLLTAGEISREGRYIVLRNYRAAWIWLRNGREPIADALLREPCPVELRREAQGEAIAFGAQGEALYTLGEGKHEPIYRYDRRGG